MTGILHQYLPPVLAVAAVAYMALAVRLARTMPRHSTNLVSFFLLLVGVLILGNAFSFGATDPRYLNMGRALAFFAAGFIPLAFYGVYREYTIGAARAIIVIALAIIPATTTALALTNSMHELVWSVIETPAGLQASPVTDHWWYNTIYAPYIYGVFAYSALAMLLRLPTIAPAHRRTVILLLSSVALPYAVSFAGTFLGLGSEKLPTTSLALALFLPMYVWVTFKMRVYEFSPLAYQTLFKNVRDPIVVLDNEQSIICANNAAEELLGSSEKEMIGQKLWEDFPEARATLRQAKELDLTQTLELNNEDTYEVSVGPLTGPRGQNLGMVVVCRDVSVRRQAQRQLAESEHLVRTLIETSSNGILRFARDDTDADNGYACVFANRAAEGFLGSGRVALVGMPLDKLSQLEPQKLLSHFEDDEFAATAMSFETCTEISGEETWLRIVAEPVGDDFSVTLVDITQRKRNEDQMLADALRDPLTGVLNRRGFEKEGVHCMRKYDKGAVLYLDLNSFKSINDRFGHQAGDALLKAFGHRLEYCMRPEDVLGRLGGDEFAIVLPGVEVEDAKHVAERLIRTASEAYIIQGQEIRCTASVGISLMPKHGEDLWHLVSVADQAMYNAKADSGEAAANDRAAYVEASIAS